MSIENPLLNVELHTHNGLDSPKVKENSLFGAIDKTTVVLLTTAQTIAGVKTFTSIPILPASDPTTDNQGARKKYVDDNILSSFLIEASDSIKDSADTERVSTIATYTKKKEIEFNEINGIIRVSFDFRNPQGFPSLARVYKNGSPIGTIRTAIAGYVTYTQDFSVATGDLIQLYLNASTAGWNATARNFRLLYTKAIVPTAGTVNLD